MQGQYNIAAHTILPLVYRILGPLNHVSYMLREPITQSLFLFNPIANIKASNTFTSETEQKYHKWLLDHVKNVEKSSGCKLTHIFCNHGQLRREYNMFMDRLLSDSTMKDTKCILPGNNKFQHIKPEVIGELSVCYIAAPGYFQDYNLIGVTHITPTSTKIPVLFVNDLLGVSRIDNDFEEHYGIRGDQSSSYMNTLDKVKYFPNESFIFSSSIAQRLDLLFAKAMLSSDSANIKALGLLEQKINLFDKNCEQNPDYLLPTTVLEEKVMNPFLGAEKFYQTLGLKSKDRVKSFSLLREMRSQWGRQNSL